MTLVTPKKEDVPSARRGPASADPEELAAAQMLRDDPGQSYRLFEFTGDRAPLKAASLASSIRKGERAAFKDGFSASARTIDGKGVVYVTYSGVGVGTRP